MDAVDECLSHLRLKLLFVELVKITHKQYDQPNLFELLQERANEIASSLISSHQDIIIPDLLIAMDPCRGDFQGMLTRAHWFAIPIKSQLSIARCMRKKIKEAQAKNELAISTFPVDVIRAAEEELGGSDDELSAIRKPSDSSHQGPFTTAEVKNDALNVTGTPVEATVDEPPSGSLPLCYEMAKAAYEWAMSEIPGADGMTYNELYEAIEAHPSDACKALPPSADTFGTYLRRAGIKRYSKDDKRVGRSIQRSDEI